MKKFIYKLFRKVGIAALGNIVQEAENNRVLIAKVLINQLRNSKDNMGLKGSEFRVFSQWGEDGIIQYLIHHVAIENDVFVEFGVENYTESNTRFLLINNNWSGLVIDGDHKNISYIQSDDIYWRHSLKAKCAFITKDNINNLLKENGISGDIGLLSVDIDGNDYWVWDAISTITPRIIVCEYNSLWGDTLAVTTPYASDFIRTHAHYSNLYFGASITALTRLANIKGYSLVGSNMAGNNAFFVRNDILGSVSVVSPREAWVQSRFRESRSESGALTFLSFAKRLALISDMQLVNIDDGLQYTVGELYSLNK
ncbi:MAG: hypothetical protein COC22_00450 [Flavobacteriaceae bacterium]|nr:MAG: hypothetical protein COC22_00450 [Flavobacteriaceae bacterium]